MDCTRRRSPVPATNARSFTICAPRVVFISAPIASRVCGESNPFADSGETWNASLLVSAATAAGGSFKSGSVCVGGSLSSFFFFRGCCCGTCAAAHTASAAIAHATRQPHFTQTRPPAPSSGSVVKATPQGDPRLAGPFDSSCCSILYVGQASARPFQLPTAKQKLLSGPPWRLVHLG